MNLPQLPPDKAAHVLYGAAIALVVAAVCYALKIQNGALWGIAVAVLLAAVKEGVDWNDNRKSLKAGLPPPHSIDFLDILATAGGALLISFAQVLCL